MANTFIDPSDIQLRKGQKIEIFSIATGEAVEFKAFVTDFQDSFESEWTSEEVYGRMDPIQTFKGTKRTISLSWDLVAVSHDDAIENMNKCASLFKMLYPTYSAEASTTMQASPLVKLKFANLVTNTATASSETSSAQESGLVGTINGFDYSPDLDQGFFESNNGASIYPQTLVLSCTFIVMHTHNLGHNVSGGSRFPTEFPYVRTGTEQPDGDNSSALEDAERRAVEGLDGL